MASKQADPSLQPPRDRAVERAEAEGMVTDAAKVSAEEPSAVHYSRWPDSNIVEFVVDGHVTEADLERVTRRLDEDIAKFGTLRALEIVRSFEGISPAALWKDVAFAMRHADAFTHAAVVADSSIIRRLGDLGDLLSRAEVKTFAPEQTDEARVWLTSAS